MARKADDAGFTAIWLRDVPFYDPTFGDLGQVFDPIAYAGFLAAATSRIAIGTAGIVLPLRDPLAIAKQATTLDHLTNNRFILGLSSGDRPVEYPAFGIDFKDRAERFRDAHALIRAVTEQDFPRHRSSHFGNLDGSLDMVPKPVRDRLPIIAVGRAGQSVEWLAENMDGWIWHQSDFNRLGDVVDRWKAAIPERAFKPYGYVIEPKFPATFGYEAAGTIDAVGPGVEGFAAGDRVAVIPAFMFDEYAMFADQAIAPARAVVKLPDGVSWENAATTWMPFTTAWGALIDIANLGAGDFVVLGAASSSVGLAAMQIAKHVGATPIAIIRKGGKIDELKGAGFVHVLQTGEDDIEREILRLTDGQGARVVFDPVTGPGLESIIKATCKDAIVFIYGALSHEATPIPVMHVLGKHTTIRGYEFIEVTGDDAKLEHAKAFINEGLRAGHFQAQVARTFAFEEVVEAYRYLESNSQFDKIVLTLD